MTELCYNCSHNPGRFEKFEVSRELFLKGVLLMLTRFAKIVIRLVPQQVICPRLHITDSDASMASDTSKFNYQTPTGLSLKM